MFMVWTTAVLISHQEICESAQGEGQSSTHQVHPRLNRCQDQLYLLRRVSGTT